MTRLSASVVEEGAEMQGFLSYVLLSSTARKVVDRTPNRMPGLDLWWCLAYDRVPEMAVNV
jgi:hypothetical protein